MRVYLGHHFNKRQVAPMADIKQTVTRTNETGVDPNGTEVQQQTKRIQTTDAVDSKTTAQNAVWYVLGFIEILLAFRFVLKLLGANPESGFVSFIYSITGVLTAPFDSIFGVTSAESGAIESVFEPSILVAAAVYAIIAWGIVKLITINRKD
jgi:hypothetical protein